MHLGVLLLALSAAISQPLRIEQGATWSRAFDSPEDLTGCTLGMEIRTAPGGTLLAAPTLTTTSLSAGTFTASLTASQTGQLTFRSAVYDVEATCSAVVRRLFEGSVTLSPGVTTDEVAPGSFPTPGTPPGSLYTLQADFLTHLAATPEAVSTTGAATYYVATTGSDASVCSVAAPCLTVQHVGDLIPLVVKHAVVINVAAGTYAEQVKLTRIIDPSGSITIQGTLAAVTPATGLASGTIASFSGRTATVTAAGWTVNDLRDKFLRTTADGELYPISANTATTVEVSNATTSLSGLAFDIVQPATIVNGGTSAGDVAFWVNQSGMQTQNFSVLSVQNGVLLKNMEIVARQAVRSNGGVKLYGDRLKYNEYGLLLESGQTAQVLRSVILEQSALGGAGVDAVWSQLIDVAGCYFRGVTGGAGVRVEGTLYFDVSSSGNVVEGHSYGYLIYDVNGVAEHYSLLRGNAFGLYLAGKTTIALVSTTISGNTYGIYQSDGGTGSIALVLTPATISSNTSSGVHLDSYASLKMLGATTITGNGANAIEIAGAHCSVEAYDTTNISSNVVFGVKTGYLASFANIYVASTCTMGSNGADFTLDNEASNFTRAVCRAAPGNTKINATQYFNRAFCP